MNKIIICLSLFALMLSAGCRTISQNYNLTYEPKVCSRGSVPQGKSLFVAAIIDERAKEEKSPFDQNNPWILIPLWPYSYDEVNPVIRYSYFQAGIKNSLSRLIAKDLAAAELYKALHVAQPDDSPAIQPEKDAYQLILRLKKATWKRYLTSYGLSYVGVYLWFLFPKSYGTVILEIEATLREPHTNRIIADEIFLQEESTTEWIYDQMNYQPPISEFAMEESFPKIMKSIRAMLLKSLKEKANINKRK